MMRIAWMEKTHVTRKKILPILFKLTEGKDLSIFSDEDLMYQMKKGELNYAYSRIGESMKERVTREWFDKYPYAMTIVSLRPDLLDAKLVNRLLQSRRIDGDDAGIILKLLNGKYGKDDKRTQSIALMLFHTYSPHFGFGPYLFSILPTKYHSRISVDNSDVDICIQLKVPLKYFGHRCIKEDVKSLLTKYPPMEVYEHVLDRLIP